jgi:Na+/H+-dicarboxylate symporter
MSSDERKKPRMSLSGKILLGMGLGIPVGLFFGEEVAFLNFAGEAFVQLLQVSILPFVLVSLIVGLGKLTYDQALALAKKGGLLLGILWLLGLAVVAVMPLSYPDWESASFFVPSLVEEPKEIDFLKLYIPANPFFSLANSIVPAIVVFGLIMGAALIGIKGKQGLLDMLSVILEVLTRVTEIVVRLAPIGVFAIAASAAGTMDFDELGRLRVFALGFIAVSIVLTFWVLPSLVTSLTPLNFREVILPVRGPLLTAFATGNLMIILPLLTERGKKILRDAELAHEEDESLLEVIVPTSFTFPTIGLLLSLGFVPFAAWFIGSSLSLAQYPMYLISGLVSFFGGSLVAMPFLLEIVRLPADMFHLFVTVDVFTGRFGFLLAGMHVWVLALLGTCAMVGKIKIRWVSLSRWAVVSMLLVLMALGANRMFFTYVVQKDYTKYKEFMESDLLFPQVTTKIYKDTPEPLSETQEKSRLEVIRERKTLRACYLQDSLPFVFRNANGKLVGFDIDMVNRLAKQLDVSLDFFSLGVEREVPDAELNSGMCDLIVPGLAPSPGRTGKLGFSVPYIDWTIAFLVEDHRRDDFSSWEVARELDAPRIGLPTKSRYYASFAKELLAQANFVQIESPRPFLKGSEEDLDAVIYGAEAGSAWTLVYPKYTVAVPLPNPVKVPISYVLPRKAEGLINFVNMWVELKKKDGTIDKIFDHWILGKAAERKEPRWSVIRDVLHWID